MIRTLPHRLHLERRLLAGLFIWPQYIACADTAELHFLSPEHATLFDCIVEAGDQLLRDHVAMPALLDVVRRRRVKGVFKTVGGVEEYVMTRLVPLPVERTEVLPLISEVRECPRCGK